MALATTHVLTIFICFPINQSIYFSYSRVLTFAIICNNFFTRQLINCGNKINCTIEGTNLFRFQIQSRSHIFLLVLKVNLNFKLLILFFFSVLEKQKKIKLYLMECRRSMMILSRRDCISPNTWVGTWKINGKSLAATRGRTNRVRGGVSAGHHLVPRVRSCGCRQRGGTRRGERRQCIPGHVNRRRLRMKACWVCTCCRRRGVGCRLQTWTARWVVRRVFVRTDILL